jgi:hypothetical protein
MNVVSLDSKLCERVHLIQGPPFYLSWKLREKS